MSNITIETIRKQVEIWEAFKGFPDEAVVRADLAAIYLEVSKKTLARLRQNGGGPPYIQNPEEESEARNQIVTYEMGDLRAYRASKKVKSSMNAAKMRGLAFATLEDLLEEQPFVMRTDFSKGRVGMSLDRNKSISTIMGHILTISDEDFSSLLSDKSMEVVWLPLPEALNENWASPKAREPFHNAYTKLLQGWIDQSVSGQEAAELHSLG